MNTTYQINARFAVSKALEAVTSWEKALEVQTAAKDEEGIRFCEASLKVSRENLAKVKESARDVTQWN